MSHQSKFARDSENTWNECGGTFLVSITNGVSTTVAQNVTEPESRLTVQLAFIRFPARVRDARHVPPVKPIHFSVFCLMALNKQIPERLKP